MTDKTLKNGDIVIQKTLSDVQQAGEGIFDNWKWVILNDECVSFDSKAHCSIPFLKESEYEVVGNILPLIQALIAKECTKARIDEVNRMTFIITATEKAMGRDSTIKLETLEASQKLRLAELQRKD